jgi:hypothetical protein
LSGRHPFGEEDTRFGGPDSLLPARRRAVLRAGTVTIDLDGTDVEVYGSGKDGIAYNYKGVRHEAPVFRVGVRDPYRRVVAAAW